MESKGLLEEPAVAAALSSSASLRAEVEAVLEGGEVGDVAVLRLLDKLPYWLLPAPELQAQLDGWADSASAAVADTALKGWREHATSVLGLMVAVLEATTPSTSAALMAGASEEEDALPGASPQHRSVAAHGRQTMSEQAAAAEAARARVVSRCAPSVRLLAALYELAALSSPPPRRCRV